MEIKSEHIAFTKMLTQEPTIFALLPNHCFRNPDISVAAKGLYSWLITLPKNRKITSQFVRKNFKEGRVMFLRLWRELIDAKYLVKKNKGGKVYWKILIVPLNSGLKSKTLKIVKISENSNLANFDYFSSDPKESNIKNKGINLESRSITFQKKKKKDKRRNILKKKKKDKKEKVSAGIEPNFPAENPLENPLNQPKALLDIPVGHEAFRLHWNGLAEKYGFRRCLDASLLATKISALSSRLKKLLGNKGWEYYWENVEETMVRYFGCEFSMYFDIEFALNPKRSIILMEGCYDKPLLSKSDATITKAENAGKKHLKALESKMKNLTGKELESCTNEIRVWKGLLSGLRSEKSATKNLSKWEFVEGTVNEAKD